MLKNQEIFKTVHLPEYQLLLRHMVRARLKARVSQEELAKAIKKPQSFVSKYENGERRLDIIEFITICRVLKVDARKLFNHMLRVMNKGEVK